MTYKSALCLLQAYSTLSQFQSESGTESQFVEGLQCGMAILLRNLKDALDLDDHDKISATDWLVIKEHINNI